MRRDFLRFLAASPLWAAEEKLGDKPIDKISDALSVLDFEAAMRSKVPPAHFGYMATGVDDDKTLKANRAAFDKYYLRPRRMVDLTRMDSSLEVYGTKLELPIVLAPTGHQRAYHADGELATTRAAAKRGFQTILSTMTSVPIEEVAQAHKGPLWYQLYTTNRWEYTENLVRHAEAVGSTALFVTVDSQGGRNTETLERFSRLDSRPCQACHPPGVPHHVSRPKPMFQGFDMKGFSTTNPAQTWESIAKFRKLTKMKLVIKGIEIAEDAKRCAELGVDGLVISNHGGRALESNRGTLDCLPEVVDAVGGKVDVFIDGGFRRGTDVFKALALGAKAVMVGRPYIWGLGAFGQEGVEAVLDILRREFLLAMRQCGTPNLAAITRSHVGRAQA